MRRIGPILGLLGIIALFGLVAGAAYSAGLGAAGVVVAPGGATAAAPVVGYGWYGVPWWGFGFGFGHVIGFLLVLFLFVALARLAFGGGRRGYGHGYGPGWGQGYGRGRRGWGGDAGKGEGESHPEDPRDAWIRSRLEDWHRTAHAGEADPSTRPGTGPTDPPAAV